MVHFQPEEGREPGCSVKCLELVEGAVILDVDKNDNPIDIEILGASANCPQLVEIAEPPHYLR